MTIWKRALLWEKKHKDHFVDYSMFASHRSCTAVLHCAQRLMEYL